MNKKILGVIPARGGSKGIKNKNIHLLNGKPLIYYTISAGKKSKILTDLIVSTDSKSIKKISESFGAKVPFLRPSKLASDEALAIPTIQHAVNEYEKSIGSIFDYIIMLQPTAPLRTEKDIDCALEQMITNRADSVISITNVENNHPYKMKIIRDGFLHDFYPSNIENPPRQSLPPVYIVNGAIYATTRDIFMEKNTFKGNKCLPYLMPFQRSVNIDEKTDIVLAEYLMKNKSIISN